jgi:tRNA pseudouridine55 synthase
MIDGVLVIDKPGGITSHDVVARVRKLLGTRKVGHLGTLDAAATGVLPIVVGKATRLSRYLPASPKEYQGRIRLGWETTTGDGEGTALEERAVEVTRNEILEAMASLTGRIEQVPPVWSAKKVGGVASHRLARAGRPVALRPITVEVTRFELVAFDSPAIAFRVVCSGGTYVRSLARDLGRKLETGAHLEVLRRTRCGVFRIGDALPPEDVSAGDLIPPEVLMRGMPSLIVDEESENRVRHGQQVLCPGDASPLCIFNKNGELIAIARAEKGWAHPEVVLP